MIKWKKTYEKFYILFYAWIRIYTRFFYSPAQKLYLWITCKKDSQRELASRQRQTWSNSLDCWFLSFLTASRRKITLKSAKYDAVKEEKCNLNTFCQKSKRPALSTSAANSLLTTELTAECMIQHRPHSQHSWFSTLCHQTSVNTMTSPIPAVKAAPS